MVSTAPARRRAAPSRSKRPILARKQREEAARFRRSLTLVGLSAAAPGSAQLIAGDRRVGTIALRAWAGLVGLTVLVLLLVPLDELAGLVVRPGLLTAFKMLACTVLLAWVALIVDAWRLGHPPSLNRRHRLIMVVTTLALSALVATPLIAAARYASAARDAVVALFPSGEAAATSDGRLNILLLGADAGSGRVGLRPDSVNVVSVDVRSGRPLLVSLPRNLEKARFPAGSAAARRFPDGFAGEGERTEWMLNATWTYGEANPDLFPGPDGPGVTAVEQAVEGTLGLPIHYYVIVDLNGFRDLIDALGGVTIRVEEELPIGQGGQVLEPGLRRLTGYEALWYARSRSSSSDYARMDRQRCVLGAILHEADPATVLKNFTALADASTSLLTTNIPQEQLPDLVEMAWQAKDQPVGSLQLVPPLVAPADPDIAVIVELIDEAIESARGDRSASAASPAPSEPSSIGPSATEPTPDPGHGGGAFRSTDGQSAVDLSSVCSYS